MDKELSFRQATLSYEEREGNKSFEATFSSDEPVRMWDYERGEYVFEILGHRTGEYDFDYLNSGAAPFLVDHLRSSDSQIGVVEKADVMENRGKASLRLSRSSKAAEMRQDIEDGIRSNISVGYEVRKSEIVGEREGLPLVHVSDWKPHEISLVSIPADTSIGIGRERGQVNTTNSFNLTQKQIKEKQKMSDDTKQKEQEALNKAREAALLEGRKAETDRVSGILKHGTRFDMISDAQDFISRGKTLEDFKDHVLENIEQRREAAKVVDPVPPVTGSRDSTDANIGMSKKEIQTYSITRAIRAFVDPKKYQDDAGFELEASRAAEAKLGREKQGSFVVPHDVMMHRDLTATELYSPDSGGQHTVQTDVLSMIDLLRNRLAVRNAGATVMSGLMGNVTFPRQDVAGTAYWLAENGSITEGTPHIDQVTLPLKTVGALTEYSRQFLLQSSIDAENFVRNDITAIIARACDNKALEGDGTSNTPTGVASTAGVGASSIGSGSPAEVWADVVNLWTDVATGNADVGSLGFISSVSTAAFLKTAKKDAGSGQYVYANGEIDGYPVIYTNQATAGKIYYGNWSDLILGFWGGLDILVDPYTHSATGAIRIVGLQSTGVAVRHPESFSVGTQA